MHLPPRHTSTEIQTSDAVERPSSGKVPHVALLIETSRSYGRGVLHGIRRYMSAHGPWSVYLELRALDSKTPSWLKNWKGDGVITRTGSQQMADAIAATGVPTVEMRSTRLKHNFHFIGVDNRAIGQMVTEHLRERGFRRFAIYGIETEDYFEERCHNFVAAVEAAGFPCDVYQQPGHREIPINWERQQLHVGEWARGLPKPVGVMACTDQLGFWFLDACRRVGVAVPEEVAVVGCENDDSLVSMSVPPLSSVQFNAEKTGYEAAALLARMMHGDVPAERHTFIPPLEIVVRQSSDIVAVEDKEIAEALRFIRENAPYGLTVDEVLRAIPMSRAALDQAMRGAIGRTVKAEILRVQLDQVKRLLADTDFSLSQIADRTGFKHPQYMAELFKKKCGKTPGAYRREFQDR
ncbi:MAG: DNA-binding transcriptional regulator [Pirellulales bacterium]